MAKKTDTHWERRTRIKAGCDPELVAILEEINWFPDVIDMKDLEVPAPPLRADFGSPIWKDDDRKQSEKYNEAELEYRDRYFAAMTKALDDLGLRGFPTAAANLVPPEHRFELNRLSTEVLSLKGEVLELIIEAKTKLTNQRYAYSKSWSDRYYRDRSIKRVLGRLASVGRDFAGSPRRIENAGWIDLSALMPHIDIDKNGRLHKQEDPFMKSIEGVDVRRIRECKICRRFFWANRKDKMCCNKKCADVYNQRLSRENKSKSKNQYYEAARKKLKSIKIK